MPKRKKNWWVHCLWPQNLCPFYSSFKCLSWQWVYHASEKETNVARAALFNTKKEKKQASNLSARRAFFPKLSLVSPWGQGQDLIVLPRMWSWWHFISGQYWGPDSKDWNCSLTFLMQPSPTLFGPGLYIRKVYAPRPSVESSKQAEECAHKRLLLSFPSWCLWPCPCLLWECLRSFVLYTITTSLLLVRTRYQIQWNKIPTW